MNYTKGFIVALLLIIVAVLILGGGGAYVYLLKNQAAKTAPQDVALPQTTIVGSYTSAKVKDSTTFMFTDNTGKAWTVDHQRAVFSEYSFSFGRVNGTDGLLTTTLQAWLVEQQHVGDPVPTISEGPGSITIVGTIDANGVLLASSIKVEGQ